MRLFAITHPHFYPGEGADITNALRTGRFERVHIRKPGATEAQIAELVEAIEPELRSRLTLHDCFGAAERLGVGGVHLNSRNPEAPAGWKGLVSASIHTIEEAETLDTRLDYALISPIFPSLSKPGYTSTFSSGELRRILRPNIFALGGVTPARLPELAEMGFRGAAMLTAAWRREFVPDQFRLQLITDGATVGEVVDGAVKAIRGGCRWVQIRMKDAPMDHVREAAVRLAPYRDSHGIILLVDDHVELAATLSFIDGVHVGKNDMPVAEARKVLGPGKILGATANTAADCIHAAEEGADYIGLGPFRFTTTKKNLSPTLGAEGYSHILHELRSRGIGIPVTAIGGISTADIPALAPTGVNGVAISGAILKAPDPEASAKEFFQQTKSLNIWKN